MPSPTDTYLETQITSATPQRLRLMLIEAAIRHAHQTTEHWDAQRQSDALESLIRCRAIVSELIAGVKADESPLARQVAGLYLYLFTSLTEAQLTHDAGKLHDALRVLEEERHTWRQVCDPMPDFPQQPATGPAREEELTWQSLTGEQPGFAVGGSPFPAANSLSLEA
jgi:flagellar protein FliS